MTKLVTYSSGTVSLPGHLWDRILDTLGDNGVAWEGEEQSVRHEHAELIEELESLDHYLTAHGGGKTDTLPEMPTVADRGAELLRSALAMVNAFGGDVPDWLRAEANALLRACADFDGFPGAKPTRIVIALEGGVVTGVVSDRGGVTVQTLDYDVEGISGDDSEPVWLIPQADGDLAEGYRCEPFEPDVDPAWIEAFDDAERAPVDEHMLDVRADNQRKEAASTMPATIGDDAMQSVA